MITRILAVRINHYLDNGQNLAWVDWVDHKGKHGSTHGDPANAHMAALIARAVHEGITVTGQQVSKE